MSYYMILLAYLGPHSVHARVPVVPGRLQDAPTLPAPFPQSKHTCNLFPSRRHQEPPILLT